MMELYTWSHTRLRVRGPDTAEGRRQPSPGSLCRAHGAEGGGGVGRPPGRRPGLCRGAAGTPAGREGARLGLPDAGLRETHCEHTCPVTRLAAPAPRRAPWSGPQAQSGSMCQRELASCDNGTPSASASVGVHGDLR